mgnify:CR=1 FL=1|tara:strand:- start:282 stop:485 length:204 start_codon:yes stop_codon:yes gene_type:complete
MSRKQLNKLYRLGDIIDGIVKNLNNKLNSYNVNRLFVFDRNFLKLLNNNIDLKNKELINLLTNYLKV